MTVDLRRATEADLEAVLTLWGNATHPSVSDDLESLRTSHAIVISTEEQAMAFWRSTPWSEDVDRARFIRDDAHGPP